MIHSATGHFKEKDGQNTIELMFQKGLILKKQMDQKNIKFVIIGTLKILLVLSMNHISVMVVMV